MAVVKVVESFQNVKIKIVESFPDLKVFVTNFKSEAKGKDEIWYFDNSFEDIKVKFVDAFEDLKIQYVNTKSLAGWVNKKHKLQNRLK